MNMSAFTDWLDIEMKKRNWIPANLADRAKVSRSTITNLYKAHRRPGVSVCKRIAKALGVEEEIVFIKAGIMKEPIQDGLSTFEKRVINRIRGNLKTDELEEGFLEIADTFIKTTEQRTREDTGK